MATQQRPLRSCSEPRLCHRAGWHSGPKYGHPSMWCGRLNEDGPICILTQGTPLLHCIYTETFIKRGDYLHWEEKKLRTKKYSFNCYRLSGILLRWLSFTARATSAEPILSVRETYWQTKQLGTLSTNQVSPWVLRPS